MKLLELIRLVKVNTGKIVKIKEQIEGLKASKADQSNTYNKGEVDGFIGQLRSEITDDNSEVFTIGTGDWSEDSYVLNPSDPSEDQISGTKYEHTITHSLGDVDIMVDAFNNNQERIIVDAVKIDGAQLKIITFDNSEDIKVKLTA